MDSVTSKFLRGSAACTLMVLAAACGGGDDKQEAAAPAATAAKTDSAAAPATATAPAPALTPSLGAPQPAPAPQPNAAVLDSAMSPREAAKAAEKMTVQGPVTPDALESYQLTMPKLRQLVAAGQSLMLLQAQNPQMREAMRVPSADPNELYRRLNTIPEAREAVARAGMTPTEYATATAALLQAIMIHEMRARGSNPQGRYNTRNVEFITEHWQEFQEMMRRAAPNAGPPTS